VKVSPEVEIACNLALKEAERRRHDVMTAYPPRPRLRAGVDDTHVDKPELARHPLEERTLPPDALDERDLGLEQRDRQRQAWESATRAEIGNGSCVANGVQLERDERIRDMDVDAALGVADRRDGRRFDGDEIEKRRERRRRSAGQAMAGCEFVETGLDNA